MIKINNTQNYKDKLVCEGILKLVDNKPIIVNESEKIEVGDWVYDSKTGQIFDTPVQVDENDPNKLERINARKDKYFKILALPEHFSPQQLQRIVDGKLKEGKCLVECEAIMKFDTPDVGKIHNKGTSFILNKETDHIPHEYQIKLNSHITIYPVEEKMLPMSLVRVACEQAFDRVINLPHDTTSFSTWWEEHQEWFEQNVK